MNIAIKGLIWAKIM